MSGRPENHLHGQGMAHQHLFEMDDRPALGVFVIDPGLPQLFPPLSRKEPDHSRCRGP
jgi:hypothetical protein